MAHFVELETVDPHNQSVRGRVLLNLDTVVEFVSLSESMTFAITHTFDVELASMACIRANRPTLLYLPYRLDQIREVIAQATAN